MDYLSYNFGKYHSRISSYMEKVINNSAAFFYQQINRKQILGIRGSNNDRNALRDCLQNLEEYLYYCFKRSPESFEHFINNFENEVKVLAVFPFKEGGIHVKSKKEKDTVFINPNLLGTLRLSREERIRLYLVHELGHVINLSWMKKAKEYVEEEIRKGILTPESAQLLYDGFSMLDEVTSQNRAEKFVYKFSRKPRPKLTKNKNGYLFNRETYKSNLDFYGELQEPAIMFARTLRGIDKIEDDIKALDMLSERATTKTFFDNIVYEYSKVGKIPELILELQYMGLIKRASRANLGKDYKSYMYNSKDYKDKLKEMTTQIREHREQFYKGDNR